MSADRPISHEDAAIPQRIAARYFRERNMTDTDRTDDLPPPDIDALEDGVWLVTGYSAATVRRLIAARDERIRVLTEALTTIRAHCRPQPGAVAVAIVATCDAALGEQHG